MEIDTIVKQIMDGCVQIADLLRDTSTIELGSLSSSRNASGDSMKKLDITSSEILVSQLSELPCINYLISEELEQAQKVSKTGRYIVAFDPLDGSSNIDINSTTGTIFCIYEQNYTDSPLAFESSDDSHISDDDDDDDYAFPEYRVVGAGYSLYSAATQMVIATDSGVDLYQLIDSEWVKIRENIIMPTNGKTYCVNESKRNKVYYKWNSLVDKFKKSMYNGRWAGSMVIDVHRILLKGGIFIYPSNSSTPEGKIREVYEAIPMAYIFDKVGGLSFGISQENFLTNYQIKDIHKTTEIMLSSSHEYTIFEQTMFDYKFV